jgi:hypothetical protein
VETEVASIGGERRGTAASGRLREVLWLAGREVRRSWISYPVTGLGTLLVGFLVAPSVEGMLSVEGFGEGGRGFEDWSNAFLADFFFLMFGGFLASNYLSWEYFRIFERDAFSERLVFVRSLPVSAGTIVGSRTVSLCSALPFNVPAFFVPVYLISDLGRLGWGFVWFVLIWVGYSLLGAGLCLLAEFGVRGKTYVRLSLAGTVLMMAAVMFLEWAVELRAVERIALLAQSSGPLAAALSLTAGATVLALMARATTRRIEGRDLSL